MARTRLTAQQVAALKIVEEMSQSQSQPNGKMVTGKTGWTSRYIDDDTLSALTDANNGTVNGLGLKVLAIHHEGTAVLNIGDTVTAVTKDGDRSQQTVLHILNSGQSAKNANIYFTDFVPVPKTKEQRQAEKQSAKVTPAVVANEMAEVKSALASLAESVALLATQIVKK